MASSRFDHAIVVGGGMAGLLAGRVLADHAETVTIFDRELPPEEPRPRQGVPQGGQPHLLLKAGQTILDQLLPGFTTAILEEGALRIDWNRDLLYFDAGGQIASGRSEIPMIAASRPLIEHVVRRQVLDHSTIRFQPDEAVFDYHLRDETVTGVQTAESTYSADLVVDASGRNSKTPGWLESNGFQRPDTDVVNVDVTYSTVHLDRPSDDHRMLFVPPSSPRKRGGGAFPIEGDRWLLTMQGMHGVTPPTQADSFSTFVEDLPLPEFGQLLDSTSIIDDNAEVYPFPSSRWIRYDHLDSTPNGLLVIGDAVASFNPIYGQGMSVAALEALVLHETLGTEDGYHLTDRYFERLAQLISPAWRLSVGNDFRFEETEGPRPFGTMLINRYVERLLSRARHDGELAETFARVAMMERPMTDLVRPPILWRVLGPRWFGATR